MAQNNPRNSNYPSLFKRYGKSEGISLASPSIDKSKSFNVDNRGELTTGEYMVYLGYLENPNLRRASRFPLVKPTRQDYSKLVKLAADSENDL